MPAELPITLTPERCLTTETSLNSWRIEGHVPDFIRTFYENAPKNHLIRGIHLRRRLGILLGLPGRAALNNRR